MRKIIGISLFLLCILLVLIAGCSSSQSTSTPATSTPIPSLTKTAITTATISPLTTLAVPSGTIIVHFIDVGQGDSELIQSPSGKVMLIDAGPTDAAARVVQYLKDQGISTIDVVVATHPHEDHIGGMAAVLNAFTVRQFIDSGTPDTTATYKNMLNIIDKKNIPFKTVRTGDTINFDPAISVQVLNPSKLVTDDYNQNSIVLKMTYGNVTYLFTGDAAEPIEEQYAPQTGHIDILKVPHHGSATSSYMPFLSAITPKVSVIDVGAGNSYGHPSSATISRLQNAGSKVYRTDQDGSITITSDGSIYSISASKQPGATTTGTVVPVLTTTTSSGTIIPISTTIAPAVTTGIPQVSCTVNYDTGTCPVGKCWVHDYCRTDGTHVNGYCRNCSAAS